MNKNSQIKKNAFLKPLWGLWPKKEKPGNHKGYKAQICDMAEFNCNKNFGWLEAAAGYFCFFFFKPIPESEELRHSRGWIKRHDYILHFWSQLAHERRNTHLPQFTLLFFKNSSTSAHSPQVACRAVCHFIWFPGLLYFVFKQCCAI